jgi:anhydro-N-acetylmuramic acid kinase
MRVSKLITQNQIQVVGIMSGTSVDGVDFVLTRVLRKPEGLKVQFVDMASVAFPPPLRMQVLKAADHELTVNALAELHFELGRFYARKLKVIAQKKFWKFDLIGLHGQTVYHKGESATLQIGEPSFLAEALHVPVVSDFRPADIAVGGQGAPLAPAFHQVAFANEGKAFAVHNLGGISNLTFFRHGRMETAFDTGPANMPMDWAVRVLSKGKMRFDPSGKLARKGKVHEPLVAEALQHPYFKKKPPKSCGREEFGEKWLKPILKKYKKLPPADMIASLTEFVARSIARSYREFLSELPIEIILCGGGAKNLSLKERIQSNLPECEVLVTEDRGWPAQAIEGAAFALLASARVWEIPLELEAATGARHPVRLGKVTDL